MLRRVRPWPHPRQWWEMQGGRGDARGPAGEVRRRGRGGAADELRRSAARRLGQDWGGGSLIRMMQGHFGPIRKYVSLNSPASGPHVADGVQNGKFQLTQEL